MGIGAGGAAAIGATASLASGALSASAAGSAASKQAGAQQQAAQMQQQQQAVTRADLMPYNVTGQQFEAQLPGVVSANQNNLGRAFSNVQGAIPGVMTQAQLEQMPGYQFQLNEGLKALQNSNAAQGLGVSGAALKGAGNFATGLANSNWQNLFNEQQGIFNDQSQQFSNAYNLANTLYNQTYGPAALGENAAAQTGIQGTQAAANAGTNIAGAGASQAAGITTAANGISNGINGAAGLGLYNAFSNQANGRTQAQADSASSGVAPINTNSSSYAPSNYGGGSDASNPYTYG